MIGQVAQTRYWVGLDFEESGWRWLDDSPVNEEVM